MLLSIGSVSTNSAFKALWSNRQSSASLGASKSRTFLFYESGGCGSYMQILGDIANNACKLPIGSGGWVHLVATFDSITNTTVTYVNGIFNETRTITQQTGLDLDFIVISGLNGTGTYNTSSNTMVYFRVWKRVLSQAEVIKLRGNIEGTSNSSYYKYTRPILINPFPFAVFNPAAGLTSASTSFAVNMPNYAVYRTQLFDSVTGEFYRINEVKFGSGAASSITFLLSGNATYTLQMFTCLYPSSFYSTI